MKMHARTAVRREWNVMCPAERGGGEESADATAACAIRLQYGDRFGIEHGAEVPSRIAILASGDIHAERRSLSDLVEPREMVRANWFFKPPDPVIREAMGKLDGLGYRVGAIRIDK